MSTFAPRGYRAKNYRPFIHLLGRITTAPSTTVADIIPAPGPNRANFIMGIEIASLDATAAAFEFWFGAAATYAAAAADDERLAIGHLQNLGAGTNIAQRSMYNFGELGRPGPVNTALRFRTSVDIGVNGFVNLSYYIGQVD